MYFFQLRGYRKSWSEIKSDAESFDELLDISIILNKEIEYLPVNVIGDLQLKLKRKARQIKTRLEEGYCFPKYFRWLQLRGLPRNNFPCLQNFPL